ncbi:MAG: cupin domain-containing protein [Evtepia sp.]
MTKTTLTQIPVDGLPLYEMQHIFHATKPANDVTFNYITLLPHQRVPLEGTGFHDADEYSFFVEGEVYTESGEMKTTCKAGDATLIPLGEHHWCENRTDTPCRLVCMMIK